MSDELRERDTDARQEEHRERLLRHYSARLLRAADARHWANVLANNEGDATQVDRLLARIAELEAEVRRLRRDDG